MGWAGESDLWSCASRAVWKTCGRFQKPITTRNVSIEEGISNAMSEYKPGRMYTIKASDWDGCRNYGLTSHRWHKMNGPLLFYVLVVKEDQQ